MTRSPAAETRAPRDLVAGLLDDLESTGRDTAPDLIMITGNLAERATSAEYETAHQFLTALRDALGIENQQIVLVPGSRDVNRGKCEAYFLQCEADDTRPVPPFWEKWQPFSTVMLRRFHGTELPKDQPWALTEHPNQRVVVAGFNTTMAITHLPGEQAGSLGDAQIDWFADELSARGRRDWFRIGVMHHRPEGEDAITDAGRFADVAGPYLDLVLHGQPGGPAVSLPGAAVPVLGSDGPWQLIEVRADQVRVLPDGEPIRLPSRSARVPKPRPRRPEPPAALRLFTEQVAEVCRLRNKGADVVPGPGQSRGRVAYLRVSPARNRSDRGPAEQHPIGVCADRPAREDVDWFAGVLAHFHTGGSESPAEMVHAGEAADPELRDWAQSRGIDLVTFSDYQVGPALRSFAENQAAELDNDTIYRSDLYVPQRFNEFLPPSATPTGVTPATDLLTWLRDWVAAPRGRLVVVLGTFGHGKTFLLKELARRLTRDAARTIPILIDLRGFEKAYSLDELVTVQLYRHGHRQVDLDVFRYLRREGRIILLFDGFDELATRVSYDRATNHLDTIVQAAEQHAKVVVTSRDQHFLTDADVLTALGTQLGTDRQVVRIGNFDDEQIIAFLTNQLRDEHDARTRFELLRGIKELLPLSRNPRMLGFITELGEDQLTPAGHPINAALLYRQVLEKWLSYEAVRLKRLGPDAPDKKVLMKAVTHLALRLWDQPDESLSLEDLGDAAVALSQLTTPDVGVPSVLEPQESAHVLGSSTLLVRSGDQRFTFVHDSVREWLIANHLATQPPGGIAADGLIGHKWQPLMIEFLCGLAGDDVMRAWAEGVLAAQPTSGVVRNNADKVLRFLGVDSSKSLNMSGVDWRGEDHSSQYLVGADLSDADLTDVNLIGANLTDATMTGANLTGARLDRAVLRGTDLSGAVLSGAWLLGADLTGSVLTGVNLRRAALVAVAGVGEDELRTADTLGAALPGGAPEIQVASAAVIQAVAVVSGVKLLAGAGADGSIRIWDAFSGRPLRVLAGHTGPLFAIAFTTDGRYLASAGDDETVRVWETTTGRPVHLLTGHSGRIRALAFSPDGKHLASAGDDEDIRIWDTDSGRRIRVMRTGGGRIRALAYQPSGGHLASGGDDEAVRVWDTTTGQPVHTLTGHTGTVYAVAYDHEGIRIASASDDRRVLVWNVAAGTAGLRLTGHTQCIRAIAFHPDGRRLASAGDEGVIRVWDSQAGTALRPLTGHAGPVHTLAYYPDGEHLASAGSDRTVRIWDTADRRPERTLRAGGGDSLVLCFSPRPDNPWLAVGSGDGAVRLWTPAAGAPPRVLHEPGPGDAPVTAIATTASGNLLATAGGDGAIRVRNPVTGTSGPPMTGHRGVVNAIAFDPSGRYLASAGADGTVRLWDVTGAEDPLTFAGGHSSHSVLAFRAVAFTPDGEAVVGGGTDGTVRIWDLRGRKPENRPGHTGTVRAIAYSPDGLQMASADDEGVIRLRGPVGGPIVLTGHAGAVTAVAYSPGGDRLASGGTDGTIRIWDTVSGRPTHTLTGQSGWVRSLSYTPDGRYVAAAGGDHAVRIWDTSRSTPHAVLVPLAENGSAVLLHDQRYVLHGRLGDEFWYAIGMCRFEPGDLDPYLPDLKPAPPGESLW
jgi:WD40 repeat protein